MYNLHIARRLMLPNCFAESYKIQITAKEFLKNLEIFQI